jgi:DNA-binding PucR family transcriptional regulator
MRRAELDPPQYVLHRCAEHGCPTYAFGSHCERHETPDDRARLAAMDAAILRAAELEEAWLTAHREALDAERAAGVRRAEPGYAAVE